MKLIWVWILVLISCLWLVSSQELNKPITSSNNRESRASIVTFRAGANAEFEFLGNLTKQSALEHAKDMALLSQAHSNWNHYPIRGISSLKPGFGWKRKRTLHSSVELYLRRLLQHIDEHRSQNRSSLDQQQEEFCLENTVESCFYVLPILSGGEDVNRQRRQLLDGRRRYFVGDRFGGTLDVPVEINAPDTNVTVTQMLNFVSGRSIIDIRETFVRVGINSSRSNVVVDPVDAHVNMSIEQPYVLVNTTQQLSLEMSADRSEAYVKTMRSNQSLIVLIDSGRSEISLSSGRGSIDAVTRIASNISIVTRNALGTPESMSVRSELNPATRNRELSLHASNDRVLIDVRLVQAYVLLHFNDIYIEIDSDLSLLAIYTGTYIVTSKTVLSPFSISLTAEALTLESDNATVRVNPSLANITATILRSLIHVIPDAATIQISPPAAPGTPTEFLNATIHIDALRSTIDVLPASARIVARVENAHSLLSAQEASVGVRADTSVVDILQGRPVIFVETFNTTIQIQRGDASGAIAARSRLPPKVTLPPFSLQRTGAYMFGPLDNTLETPGGFTPQTGSPASPSSTSTTGAGSSATSTGQTSSTSSSEATSATTTSATTLTTTSTWTSTSTTARETTTVSASSSASSSLSTTAATTVTSSSQGPTPIPSASSSGSSIATVSQGSSTAAAGSTTSASTGLTGLTTSASFQDISPPGVLPVAQPTLPVPGTTSTATSSTTNMFGLSPPGVLPSSPSQTPGESSSSVTETTTSGIPTVPSPPPFIHTTGTSTVTSTASPSTAAATTSSTASISAETTTISKSLTSTTAAGETTSLTILDQVEISATLESVQVPQMPNATMQNTFVFSQFNVTVSQQPEVGTSSSDSITAAAETTSSERLENLELTTKPTSAEATSEEITTTISSQPEETTISGTTASAAVEFSTANFLLEGPETPPATTTATNSEVTSQIITIAVLETTPSSVAVGPMEVPPSQELLTTTLAEATTAVGTQETQNQQPISEIPETTTLSENIGFPLVTSTESPAAPVPGIIEEPNTALPLESVATTGLENEALNSQLPSAAQDTSSITITEATSTQAQQPAEAPIESQQQPVAPTPESQPQPEAQPPATQPPEVQPPGTQPQEGQPPAQPLESQPTPVPVEPQPGETARLAAKRSPGEEFLLAVKIRKSQSITPATLQEKLREGLQKGYVEARRRQLGLSTDPSRLHSRRDASGFSFTNSMQLTTHATAAITELVANDSSSSLLPETRNRKFVDELNTNMTLNGDVSIEITSIDNLPEEALIRFYIVSNGRPVKASYAKETLQQLSESELSALLSYPVIQSARTREDETLPTFASFPVAILCAVGAAVFILITLTVYCYKRHRLSKVKEAAIVRSEASSPTSMVSTSKYRSAAVPLTRGKKSSGDISRTSPDPDPVDNDAVFKRLTLPPLDKKLKLLREISADDIARQVQNNVGYEELFAYVRPPVTPPGRPPKAERNINVCGFATNEQHLMAMTAARQSVCSPFDVTQTQIVRISPTQRRRQARELLDAAFPSPNVEVRRILNLYSNSSVTYPNSALY